MKTLEQIVEDRKKNLLEMFEIKMRNAQSMNEAIKSTLDVITNMFDIGIKTTDRLEYENQDLANFKQSYENILKMYKI